MNVGDKVKAKINLDEYNDCHGHSRCAAKGDTLIIRELTSFGEFLVSHEHRTDGMTFYATKDELEITNEKEIQNNRHIYGTEA